MDLVDNHLVRSVVDVDDAQPFQQFIADTASGIAVVPEVLASGGLPRLKPDGGDFLKWLMSAYPEVNITPPPDSPKIVLHSADVWLPLMYLASDTSVQVALGIITNYLYDRMKGSLKSDRSVVDFSIVYEDRQSQKIKRLNFKGTAEDLAQVMKKFDANNFFNDAT